LIGTGAVGYGAYKAYRYFRPAQTSKALVVVGQPITSIDFNDSEAIKAEHKAKRAAQKASYENAIAEYNALEKAVKPSFFSRFKNPFGSKSASVVKENASEELPEVAMQPDFSGSSAREVTLADFYSDVVVPAQVAPRLYPDLSSELDAGSDAAVIAQQEYLARLEQVVRDEAIAQALQAQEAANIAAQLAQDAKIAQEAQLGINAIIAAEKEAQVAHEAAIAADHEARLVAQQAAQIARIAAELEAEQNAARLEAQLAHDLAIARELESQNAARLEAQLAQDLAMARELESQNAARIAAELEAQIAQDLAMARALEAAVNAAPVVVPAQASSSSVAPVVAPRAAASSSPVAPKVVTIKPVPKVVVPKLLGAPIVAPKAAPAKTVAPKVTPKAAPAKTVAPKVDPRIAAMKQAQQDQRNRNALLARRK